MARNATARWCRLTQKRAERWVAAMPDAEVVPYAHFGRLRYRASVRGFWPQNAPTYALAVEALDGNVAHFCQSGAETAPRGARMAPIRAARAAWEAAGGD